MSHRYSTALSHLILVGTGIYCFHIYHAGGFRLPCGSYIIIITNSLLGIWRWGNPDYGQSIEGVYSFTSFLQTLTTLPLIAAQIWMNLGYQYELAFAHAGASLIPLSLYLLNKSKEELTDTLIAIDGISMGIVSLLHENFYGVAASLSYMFNYFFLRDGRFDVDLPILDLYNYGLCFFCFFALKAL